MKQALFAVSLGIAGFFLAACKGEVDASHEEATQNQTQTNATGFSDKNLKHMQRTSGITLASMLCLQNMQRKTDIETIQSALTDFNKRNILKIATITQIHKNTINTKEAKKRIDEEAHKIAMKLVRTQKPTAITCNGLAKRMNSKEFDL